MIDGIWERLKARSPLVFCLTNYVTVNDCANMLLAAGASPVMSLDPREAEDFAVVAGAVVINIGSPSVEADEAMLLAGKAANRAGVPVVLDPVGAGATQLRRDLLARLLDEVHFTIIRGNASEIRALAGGAFNGRGVDAGKGIGIETTSRYASELAVKVRCVVGVSGENDLITDGERTILVRNGDARMPLVTGSGCMLSALTGGFAGVEEDPFAAATVAFIAMGCSGELAASRMLPGEGTSAFRSRMIDAMSLLDGKTLKNMAKYEKM